MSQRLCRSCAYPSLNWTKQNHAFFAVLMIHECKFIWVMPTPNILLRSLILAESKFNTRIIALTSSALENKLYKYNCEYTAKNMKDLKMIYMACMVVNQKLHIQFVQFLLRFYSTKATMDHTTPKILFLDHQIEICSNLGFSNLKQFQAVSDQNNKVKLNSLGQSNNLLLWGLF